MNLPKPKFSPPFRRPKRQGDDPVAAPGGDGAPKPARGADDAQVAPENEAGWRASSYDLKRGLDVVELPTSLPPDVLDRLFNAPRR